MSEPQPTAHPSPGPPTGRSVPATRFSSPTPRAGVNTITLQPGKQYHTHKGTVPHDDIIGSPEGSVYRSSGGTEYLAFRPLLADYTLRMPRGAAVVYPKDAAQIVAMADIFPGARVVEAGAGSGALTCCCCAPSASTGIVSSYERRAGLRRDRPRQRREATSAAPTPPGASPSAPSRTPSPSTEVDRVVLDMLAPWECPRRRRQGPHPRRRRLRLRRHHHPAVPRRRGPPRARQLRRALRLRDPRSAPGTSTASPYAPTTA